MFRKSTSSSMADSTDSTSCSTDKDHASSVYQSSQSPQSSKSSANFGTELVASPTSTEASLSPPLRPARSSRIRFGGATPSESTDEKIPSPPLTLSPPPNFDGPSGLSSTSSKGAAPTSSAPPTASPPRPSLLGNTVHASTAPKSGSLSPSGTSSGTASTFTSFSTPFSTSSVGAPPGDSSPKPSTPPAGIISSAPGSPPPNTLSSPYTISPIDSATSHRVIRTIVHNGYAAEQAEAEALAKRQRTYFVATDLSDEAAYALEWTISNFLRNGDTLLAIYAVEAGDSEGIGKKDKEKGESKLPGSPPSSGRSSATPGNATPISNAATPDTTGAFGAGGTETSTGLPIGSGGVAMLDAQDTIRKLNSREESVILRRRARSRSASRSGSGSRNHTPNGEIKPVSKADNMRLHAIRLLTQICTRALEKRDIKVQVAIEVIHCKSPKHMITEAIDTLEPTLVILGSRGRSALKGVLLGSFSNYLVTKSSVPVLVARKQSSTSTNKPSPAKDSQRAPSHPHLPQILRQIGYKDGMGEIANRLVTARVD